MDPEIKAMSAISDALGALDEGAVARVLKWAAERYGVKLVDQRIDTRVAREAPGPANGSATSSTAASAPAGQGGTFDSFHELFDAADPKTSVDKALVAAYWFQCCKNAESLESKSLNDELKNLGHPSSNITRDLDQLIGRTPRLVMQVRKDGTTKQARKKYKVTREGLKEVERMISGAGAQGSGSE